MWHLVICWLTDLSLVDFEFEETRLILLVMASCVIGFDLARYNMFDHDHECRH
jgi:GTP-sensing pleiotropic transcriptional regulator CodY